MPGTYALKVAPLARGPGEKKIKATTQSSAAIGLAVERRAYALQLRGVPNIPALAPGPSAFGDDQGFRYMAMQKMSITLKEKLDQAGGRFSAAAVAHVGAAMVCFAL